MTDLFATPSVYRTPELDAVTERKGLPFKDSPDGPLHLDVYGPTDRPRPATVLVYGDGPAAFLENARGWGVFRDHCRHLALRGIAGIAFDHRSARERGIRAAVSDVDDALGYVRSHADELGVDPNRIAVWTFSAGPPFAFHAILRDRPSWVRALVAYYGVLDLALVRHPDPAQRTLSDEDVARYSPRDRLRDGRPLPPMLVARAGKDAAPLNASIDAFVADAIAAGATLDLLTHPTGQHGFDLRDDDERSREIIRATLDFLARRLG